jgi:hypothetical protein
MQRAMTRGRLTLLAFAAAALMLIVSPALVIRWYAPTICPTVVVSEGRVPNGVAWDITRSDCDAGRTVWQVRVAPVQGVLRLAYDAERGPEPVAVEQNGRTLSVRLKTPLADGSTVAQVELDHRARPREPVRFIDGRPRG